MSTAASAQVGTSNDAIVDELLDSGRYIEGDLTSGDSSAIDQANNSGVAFVWLNQPTRTENEAQDLATELLSQVRQNDTSFTHVVVLIDDGEAEFIGLGGWSSTSSSTDVDAAIEAASNQFAAGEIGAGITSYTESVDGTSPSDDNQDSSSTRDSSTNPSSNPTGNQATEEVSSGGGIGFFGLFLILLIVGGGLFLLFRVFSGRRKGKKAAIEEMEADRSEITEQLKSNADRVITLGDEVILSKNDELIRTYEEASTAYQEVSTSLSKATTPDQVDLLDDKIDKAEWQFDVIEAKLAGKPAPLSPAEKQAKLEQERKTAQGRGPQDSATSDKPALGRDESVFSGGGRQQPRQRQRRSSGGGMMGGGLGGILGSILMGGSLGGRRPSRLTQRRRIGGTFGQPPGRSSGGFNDPFGGSRRSSGGGGGGRFRRSGGGGGGRFKRR